MINDTKSNFLETIHLPDSVDTMFDELQLSFQWRKPAYIMSVYNSPSIQKKAMTGLARKLLNAGYSIKPVNANKIKFADFIETALKDTGDDKKVYFIENIFPANDQEDLTHWWSYIYQHEDVQKKLIRLVFWLTENELVDLVHNFPDFWENRYRVIDLTDGSATIFEHHLKQEQYMANIHTQQADLASDVEEDMTTRLTREVRELLADGILEWQQGDFYNACQYLHNAADLADVVQDAQLQVECQQALAFTHINLENYDRSIEAYQKILELDPQNNLAWKNLGNLYLQLDDMPRALDAFIQAIRIDQNDAANWEGSARVYARNGLNDKAIRCYRRAITLVPDFANAWEGLGNVFESLRKWEQAAKSYQKAISKEPARVSTWLRLANIYAAPEKAANAIAILKKAVEINSTDTRLWLELGSFYLNSDNSNAAVNAFTRALELSPCHGLAYCRLADAHKSLENIQEAINCYELGMNFIEDEQQRATSWQNLMILKARQNGTLVQDLLADSETSVAESPALQQTEQIIAAPEQVSAAGSAQETTNTQVLSAADWNELGDSNLSQGNYDQAIESYAAAIESSTEDFWPYIHNLANAYLQKGKADDEARLADAAVPTAEPIQSVLEPEVTVISGELQKPQPAKNLFQQVAIAETMPGVFPSGIKELIGSSNPRSKHLDVDQVERVSLRNNSRSYACPKPMRNKKEWAQYQKYSERILASWTQHERNKLLLDAFLEQPRAEHAKNRKPAQHEAAVTEMPAIFVADVNYEKKALVSNKKPVIDAADRKTTMEDEKWAQAWIHQGNFLVKKCAYEDAASAFSMAISLAPGVGSTYNNLGLVFFQQEKYRDAVSQFNKAINLITDAKEKSTTWNYLGDAYRRLHDEEHALQAYQKAMEINNSGSALKWRARQILLQNCQ